MTESQLEQVSAAPPEDGEHPRRPEKEMSAGEALEKLRQGVTLQNVRVERLRFTGEFPLPVRLHNCHLVRPQFDGAVFKGAATFAACTLDHLGTGRATTFEGDLCLDGSRLMHPQLSRLTLKGRLSLANAEVQGRFNLTDSRLEGGLNFWDAQVSGWFNLKGCEVLGQADLRSVQLKQGASLQRCQFRSDVLLRGASVALKLDLTGSHFARLLDFSKAKLHDYVYLESIEQGPDQTFAFANTLGERVLIQREQLEGRLGSEKKGDYAQAAHEYAFLKRAFGALHRYELEDWAFYRFKVNQRRCCERTWKRPWTKAAQFASWLFLDHGCGYCTNPYRAVRAAAVIIVLFGLFYGVGVEYLHVDPAKRPFPNEPVTSLGNRVMIAALVSVSVFTSGVGGIREMAAGWMNVPLIVESLLGTLLWGLFIVAFSRKVIR